MTINDAAELIFNQESSELYGVRLCDFESVNEESNDEESDLVTSTTAYRRTYSLHSVEKTAPLKFKITLCKYDKKTEMGSYIDSETEETLKEWLCTEEYGWLSFDQIDLYNKLYYCVITNPQKLNVGRYSGCMQFTITCNANNAWSKEIRKEYTTVNGTLTFNHYNMAKYNKYELSPTLVIAPTANGNITIKNNTNGKLVTINNCVTTETITLDCENEAGESTSRNIINDWNIEFLSLDKGLNNITLTGNFKMIMEYRLPIRIGG